MLPTIPGGWTLRDVPVGDRTFRLELPADPDLFLDDPDVLAANARDDYMPYWAFLWPSAVPTAEALLQFAPWPVGTRVLELGCGLGLVGLAALARGDDVLFTDHDPICLNSLERNAALNSLPAPDTLQLDWRVPLNQTFPVIVGCEVTYDANMHPVLLDLLDKMLSPDGLCWFSDPGRFQAPRFCKLASERGYNVRVLNSRGEECAAPSEQGFQILELRHRV
ncbi:MAG: methyltransferase domain-containing protein [Planctomycetaceae bacterium]|nr:methyltransferase domain-containing protein [Planctomycetaceae bacterium]